MCNILYINIYTKHVRMFVLVILFSNIYIYILLHFNSFLGYNNWYNINVMQIVAIVHCLGKSNKNTQYELILTHLIFKYFQSTLGWVWRNTFSLQMSCLKLLHYMSYHRLPRHVVYRCNCNCKTNIRTSLKKKKRNNWENRETKYPK